MGKCCIGIKKTRGTAMTIKVGYGSPEQATASYVHARLRIHPRKNSQEEAVAKHTPPKECA